MNKRDKKMGEAIGKVQVSVGNSTCKVPVALDYIKKLTRQIRERA